MLVGKRNKKVGEIYHENKVKDGKGKKIPSEKVIKHSDCAAHINESQNTLF